MKLAALGVAAVLTAPAVLADCGPGANCDAWHGSYTAASECYSFGSTYAQRVMVQTNTGRVKAGPWVYDTYKQSFVSVPTSERITAVWVDFPYPD